MRLVVVFVLGFFVCVLFCFFSSRSYLLAPPGEDEVLSLVPTPRLPSHSSTLPLVRQSHCIRRTLQILLILPIPLSSLPSHYLSISKFSLHPRSPHLPRAWWDVRKEKWGVGDLPLTPTTVCKLLSFSMPVSSSTKWVQWLLRTKSISVYV